jgi:hypothetical protein
MKRLRISTPFSAFFVLILLLMLQGKAGRRAYRCLLLFPFDCVVTRR